MEIEIWRKIPEYEFEYMVSDLGRIKSLKRKDSLGRTITEKIIKLNQDTNGYLQIVLSKKGLKRKMMVHRLVAEIFIKNHGNKKYVIHRDYNKKNNKISNLLWSNTKQYPKTNNKMMGDKNPRSKLHQEDVLAIRKMYSNNKTELAKLFNISESTIRNIVSRRTWKFI